jgi:hypothetical protein
LFWYTYRDQTEPEGGRQSEDQLNDMYAAQIKREIEMEVQNASRDNEALESSDDEITS